MTLTSVSVQYCIGGVGSIPSSGVERERPKHRPLAFFMVAASYLLVSIV